VLISTAMCAVGMLGMLGLAVDLGHLYIIRNEMQTYADAAAVAAAVQLDGTAGGIARAAAAAATLGNQWNLGSAAVTGAQVEFAATTAGPWLANPPSAGGYAYVRVRATAAVGLYFLPAVGTPSTAPVAAVATAAQMPKETFRNGLFPFSPLAHSTAGPNFGFTPGEQYTLRWPASPKAGKNLCAGDDAETWVELAKAGGGSERGYIEDNSASAIRQAILEGAQTYSVAVGGTVAMTGGAKQTALSALQTRIGQDSDALAATYSAYDAGGNGNGRRLVPLAINTGNPNYTVLGFGLFLLLPASEYESGGNSPWCAEYVGPYVEGSRRQGAGDPGAYMVRLIR
jgi:Flp pilus assembly protein TadG